MKLAFTGTRQGMTDAQRQTVKRLLETLKPTEVHHGDCVGSDDDFANICHNLDARPRIVAHPGKSATGMDDHDLRAHNAHNDEILPIETHFKRNRTMVKLSPVLIATPYESAHQKTGGTWYTIDLAKKSQSTVFVVWPDGSVE